MMMLLLHSRAKGNSANLLLLFIVVLPVTGIELVKGDVFNQKNAGTITRKGKYIGRFPPFIRNQTHGYPMTTKRNTEQVCEQRLGLRSKASHFQNFPFQTRENISQIQSSTLYIRRAKMR